MKAILFLSLFISFQSGADNAQLHQLGRIVGVAHPPSTKSKAGFCFECVQELVDKSFTPVSNTLNNMHKKKEDILVCQREKQKSHSRHFSYEKKCSDTALSHSNALLLRSVDVLRQQVQETRLQIGQRFTKEGQKYNTLHLKWTALKRSLNTCHADLNSLKVQNKSGH